MTKRPTTSEEYGDDDELNYVGTAKKRGEREDRKWRLHFLDSVLETTQSRTVVVR